MKINTVINSILLIMSFTLYMIIELKPPFKEKENQSEEKTKKLQIQNDSLKKTNLALDENLNTLALKADSLQKKLIGTKQIIIQLKNKKNEKLNTIDALTNDELFSFFAKFNAKNSDTK